MKNDSINILGISAHPLTIEQANNQIALFANENNTKSSRIVVKPYVEFLVAAQKDPEIGKLLNQADLSLADGVSLQWAASYLYGKPSKKLLKIPRSGAIWLQKPAWRAQVIPEKMAGATQTTALLHLAELNKWRVGILGGINSPDQIKNAVSERFPGLSYLETWSGFNKSKQFYTLTQEKELVKNIADANLDVLFVAISFPLQVSFMFRNKNNSLAKIMIGEGGTFDYEQMGGPIRRSPRWMQKTGTEWLWRLLRQPKRITRQLAIPRFVWAVKKQSKSKP